MVHMAAARGFDRQPVARSPEIVDVSFRRGSSLVVPLIEVSELHPENRGLHRIEPVVVSHLLVDVPLELRVMPERSRPFEHARIARRYRSPLAERPEILARIEGKRSRMAEGTRPPPLVCRSVPLAGILDDDDAVLLRELHDRIHVAGLPEKVNRNDRLRPRA